jgi:hypothetical protein
MDQVVMLAIPLVWSEEELLYSMLPEVAVVVLLAAVQLLNNPAVLVVLAQ